MKTCQGCAKEFTPSRPLQAVCSLRCAVRQVKAKKTAVKRQISARKEALKPRSKWLQEAQASFNTFVRIRDAQKPCICCGKWSSGESRGGDWDCGHYRSTGSAPELRFDERNAHRQLKQCNRYGAGRAVDYRIGLIERIGLDAVESLESKHPPKKWTIEELKAIKAEYRAKAKEYEARSLQD